jgi:arylsulfatase A-like enzyme
MDRRAFLKFLGIASLGLALPPSLLELTAAGSENAQPDATGKPNILIVILDALSADHLSLHGYPRETMPNLSQLVQKAVVFHNHYSGGNFTSPGTASLLTGTLPWTHRALRHNGKVVEPYPSQNIFQAFSGYYRTVYTHNTLVASLFNQFTDGIQEYIPREKLFLSNDEIVSTLFKRDYDIASLAWARTLKKQDEGHAYSLYFSEIYRQFRKDIQENIKKNFPLGIPFTNQDNYYLLEQAVEYMLGAFPELPKPFLAYYHLLPPHNPYNTRNDFYQRFRKDGYQPVRKTEHLFTQDIPEAQLDKQRQAYDEFILYADAEFGRLFQSLEASGMLENTWVVLTSDHGELFERGAAKHLTPLLNQAVIRIPLVIWEPGRTERLDVQQKTSAIDVLPTLLQVTGHPLPGWGEGHVLPPYAADNTEHPIFVVEAKSTPVNEPIRAGSVTYIKDRYKLIDYFGYPELDEGKDLVELYDIENDPEELNNLADTHKDIRDEYLSVVKRRLAEANKPYS